MADLKGKVAIVTGSTKGIGLAIAEAMAGANAGLVVTSRSESDTARVAQELAARGEGEVIGAVSDLRDAASCRALVQSAVDHFGRLDVLVNNAGIGNFGAVDELSPEAWESQLETNLSGVFHCSRTAVPHLSATGDGWIVNIGSLAGRNAFAGGAGYNATKFGLLGLSEAMMLDLRYRDIRVSTVMPGSVATSFGRRDSSKRAAWRLRPEDVASAVMHLFGYPKNAHVSRIEMRPNQPPR